MTQFQNMGSRMGFLTSLKMRNKIILLLLFPILGMAFLVYSSAADAMEKSRISSAAGDLEVLSELSVKIGNLVHELQKERAASALYIGSNGAKYGAELQAQKSETDKKLTELEDFLKDSNLDKFGSEVRAPLQNAMNELDALRAKRDAVSALSISGPEAIEYYTRTIAALLEVNTGLSSLSPNAEISAQISAYVNLLQAKERAGQERAILTSAFVADRFSAGMYDRFTAVVAAQDVYTNVFLSFAAPEQKEYYRSRLSGSVVEEAARMRKIAVEKAEEGEFGIDSAYWVKMQTGKIDLLKEVEDRMAGDLRFKTDAVKKEAEVALRTSTLVMGAAVVVVLSTLAFAYLITRSITRPLNTAVSTAESIAAGDLTVEVAADGRGDEMGALTQAYNKMLANLRSIVTQVQRTSQTVSATAQELGGSGEEMTATTQQVSTTVQQISQGT